MKTLVAGLDLSARPRELSVRLPRPATGGALVVVHTCDALPGLSSTAGEVLQLPDTLVVLPPPGTQSLRLGFPQAPCRLKSARWLAEWRREWGRSPPPAPQ